MGQEKNQRMGTYAILQNKNSGPVKNGPECSSLPFTQVSENLDAFHTDLVTFLS
jgi:hypothetical protein